MSYEIERSDEEIDRVMNAVAKQEESGASKWPGQSYEQGVRAALGWVIGEYDDDPMPKE